MKGSIAAKVFFSATGLFLLLLLAQWVIISTSFQSLYVDSILTSMERELQNAVAPYRRNRATQYFQPFDSYVEETGSPIFVFTDSYDIVDGDEPRAAHHRQPSAVGRDSCAGAPSLQHLRP